MIDTLKAVILGVIQGLTEFLPVSSSGHLEIGKALLGQDLSADESLLMTVVLHAATALSTIVVFRTDIADLFRGCLAFQWNEQVSFVTKVVLSMIPAAIVGVAFNDEIEAFFDGNLRLVGSCLLATGVLLFLAGRAKNTEKSVSLGAALVVGIAQAIAILPGVSRSGATISTCVLLGIDREKAARFSFLMVVPLIMGKMAKDLLDGEFSAGTVPWGSLLCGFVAAFVTGLFACKWMIALVRNCQLWWFSIYCFIVGAIAIGITFGR